MLSVAKRVCNGKARHIDWEIKYSREEKVTLGAVTFKRHKINRAIMIKKKNINLSVLFS